MGSVSGTAYLTGFYWTDIEVAVEETLRLEEEGLIDHVANLEEDNVYIWQGYLDTIVYSGGTSRYIYFPFTGFICVLLLGEGQRMKEFYEHFISSDRIELKNDVAAEHGLPTDDAAAGGPCEELNPPFYVNNCHYSGARHILNKVCRYVYIVYSGQLSAMDFVLFLLELETNLSEV